MKKWVVSKERYKEMLDKNGVNTAFVCRETGIPDNLISQWLSDESRNIGLDTAKKLADFFNTSIEYLLVQKEV